MKSIPSQDSFVHFNEECYPALNTHIEASNYSTIIIIVDTNTFELCYPNFIQHIVTDIPIEVIQIDAGEEFKNIETCTGVWNALSELNIDRKSLIINLGGGVVTDLGGFIACTYKRGVNYINVPTSLLAMVDASVGGKTGVDLGSLKNQIGIISTPEMVLIDTSFLKTLPQNQMRSGLAEILKHGLIQSEAYWNKTSNLSQLSLDDLDHIIYESVMIKNKIVTADPTELGLRKTLNFGHTLGHAIESYFLAKEHKEALLHGEAIAIGMILATYIATRLTNFNPNKCLEIKNAILNIFPKVTIEDQDIPPILELMRFDKKNSHGNINFVLLEDIGKTIIDIKVPNDIIYSAFDYYRS